MKYIKIFIIIYYFLLYNVAVASSTSDMSDTEQKIKIINTKASYILRFVYYVNNWKYSDRGNKYARICFTEKDSPLFNVTKKQSENPNLAYSISVLPLENIDLINRCDAIYSSGINIKKTKELLKKTYGQDILTITEGELIWDGAILSFYQVGHKLRFYLNDKAVKDANLMIDKDLYINSSIINKNH